MPPPTADPARRAGAAYATLADAELATLAQTGDRAAFGELVRRHGAQVRSLVRRMGAEPSFADDIAQDAFLAAYERIGEFRGEGAFVGWVKRIAARLYVKRCKGLARLIQLDGDEDGRGASTDGEAAEGRRLDLDGALRALSPAERMCVSLCCGAGLSHAEAAEALKTPLGTVKSHVRRGLEKMKAQLAPVGAP